MISLDIKNDKYHTGNLILDTFKSRPDAICQIDAATGESETNASVLARSIQLAKCFRKFGAKPGDVMALGGRNHLDLHIPYYAALMNGYPIAAVDPQFKYNEIKSYLEKFTPRIAFCQVEHIEDYLRAVGELGFDTKVICFDDGENSLKNFIREYGDTDNQEFEPEDFTVDETIGLISTGGTTGVVKLAVITHRAFLKKLHDLLQFFKVKIQIDGNNVPSFNSSPIQWVTGFLNAVLMPVLQYIKVQSSAPHTTDHIIDIINKYKPISMTMGPSLAISILKGEKECDLSCFHSIVLSGGKASPKTLAALRNRVPTAWVVEMYGQTENLGVIFQTSPLSPLGSCGKVTVTSDVQVKLVDPKTGKEVTAPYENGELWTTNASFSGYYKDPKESAAVFSEDGWFKTGDSFYRDEQGYFFFVERLKMLIKYRCYHVVPPELEAVIIEHPGVLDVSVTAIDHEDDGEHPVACVVRRPGTDVTAQEIKDLVASILSDSKKLRGGVVFMDKLPFTSTGKVARGRLRQIVKDAIRE